MGVVDTMKFAVEKLKGALFILENSGSEALARFDRIVPPETRREKISQWLLALENSGSSALARLYKMIPAETRRDKIINWLISLENSGDEALTRFDKVFPPETRAEKISHWIHVALPYLIAAVVFTVVVRLCCRGRRGGGWVKMMKAPGRNSRMARRVFESNPKGYFSNLRAYPGDKHC